MSKSHTTYQPTAPQEETNGNNSYIASIRQEKSSNQLSLPQRDDCTTRKTRAVKQPALSSPAG